MARSRIEHFPDISIVHSDCVVKVPFWKLGEKLRRAQYALDGAVMNSMVRFMPMVTGNFIQQTRAISAAMQGTGRVCAAAPPSGRFLYMGKVMVGETSHSPWAMQGEKKVVTDRNIRYTTTFNTQAQAHWFDAAKDADQKIWLDVVKKELK